MSLRPSLGPGASVQGVCRTSPYLGAWKGCSRLGCGLKELPRKEVWSAQPMGWRHYSRRRTVGSKEAHSDRWVGP